MSRPRTLTDQQRLENRKKLDTNIISFSVDSNLESKITKFSSQYKSKGAAIRDLIKTHPDFLKMFPPPKKLKLYGSN